MAILWCDSFNSYGTTADVTKMYGSNASNLWTINLTGGPDSSPAVSAASSSAVLTTALYGTPASTALGGRFRFKQAAPGSSGTLLSITHSNGSSTWRIGTTAITGVLFASTQLAGAITNNGTTDVCNNIWHTIEFQVDAKDSGGVVKVWIDGVLEINVSGDTLAVALAVGASTWGTQLQLVGNGATGIRTIDDLLIFDSAGAAGTLRTADQPYGTLVIATLRPSGAGSSTQFTPSAGSNYQCVDETALDTADYVSSATSGHRDLYAMGNMGVVPTTTYAYVAKVFADNPGGGTISLKQTLKSGATTVTSTTTVANLLGDYVVTAYDTDPNGSIAWTQTNIDAVEQGFEVV